MKVGVFSSVRNAVGAAAEIYSTASCPALTLTTKQLQQLQLFSECDLTSRGSGSTPLRCLGIVAGGSPICLSADDSTATR